VGIPEGTKLTSTEWTALRAALGTPRRLSLSFLREVRPHGAVYAAHDSETEPRSPSH
jgi:hypothetical protein